MAWGEGDLTNDFDPPVMRKKELTDYGGGTPDSQITLVSVRVLSADITIKNGMRTSGFLSRRPQTSYTDHRFAPSPRIRSASCKPDTTAMPRSHVSIARFYDWSEDLGDCVSVSKYYRDLATVQKNGTDKFRGRTPWCSNGVRVSPGRMFLRDKAGLTKGEKDIIEGIYRNRGDVLKDETQQVTTKDEWQLVKSHKDAWLVGKSVSKNGVRSDGVRTDSSVDLKLPDNLFSRSVDVSNNSDSMTQSTIAETNSEPVKEDDILVAPPSTPDRELTHGSFSDNSSSANSRNRTVYRCGERSVMTDSDNVLAKSQTFRLESSEHQKRKVFVNVFLPQSSPELLQDRTRTSMEKDRSSLTRGSLRRDGTRFSRYTGDNFVQPATSLSYSDSRRHQRGLTGTISSVGD
ncbi:uncharacterized protein LOC110455447 isoform X2 [Mizuhopecten yessoensis]|uniref:uncharacterized protein LOC110455447 isoform X2 n=1 Tax=Mizuhopecten yessoensis TaxID=6573 RepID=UPI000B45B6FC|nr:uncharacterized protein LOC110455447 isoform X2 [Mizuhopecten yessoensis]